MIARMLKAGFTARVLLSAGVILGVFAGVKAGQIDFETFLKLKPEMLESEVLIRAGPPDLVTTPGGFSEVRRLHYIPGPGEHDPFLTVITIRNGRIAHIERRKQFSAIPLAPDDSTTPSERRSDEEIRVQRADDTLKAAEHYSDTRARLLNEAARPAETAMEETPAEGGPRVEAVPIYEAIQPDGSVYYGDRPPRDDDGPMVPR